MNKLPKLRGLLKIYILLALLSNVTRAYSSGNGTYRTNFCLCQMDVYLLTVRQRLSIGQVPPPTPPTTTPAPTTTNTASTTTANTGSTTVPGSTTTNTATTTTGPTTVASSTTTNTATTTTGPTTVASSTTTNTATTTTGPTTVAGLTTTNTASTTTGPTIVAGSSTTNTVTGGLTSTTQAAIGKRRKRQAGASGTTVTSTKSTSVGTGSAATAAATVAATVATTTKGTTKIASATTASTKITLGGPRDYIAGISTPTFGVVFDGTVKLVDDYGVIFDSNYNPSLCSCTTNQTVEVALCLLNVPYNSSYADINSTQSHAIVGKLLPWFDETLINAFKSNPIYIRVLPKKIQIFNNKSAQIVVQVSLRNVTYKPDYFVNNAINPSLTVVILPADIMGYQVDNTQTGCYSVVDVTPAIPVIRSASYYLRFLAIPVALVVLALMIFCTCCGSRDKFYVRFW